jgi:hypothetical protein
VHHQADQDVCERHLLARSGRAVAASRRRQMIISLEAKLDASRFLNHINAVMTSKPLRFHRWHGTAIITFSLWCSSCFLLPVLLHGTLLVSTQLGQLHHSEASGSFENLTIAIKVQQKAHLLFKCILLQS